MWGFFENLGSSLSPATVGEAIFHPPPVHSSSPAAIRRFPSPPPAAPAAGGWGNLGSRLYIARCEWVPVGGARERMARPSRWFVVAEIFSGGGGSADPHHVSASVPALASRWRCRASRSRAGDRVRRLRCLKIWLLQVLRSSLKMMVAMQGGGLRVRGSLTSRSPWDSVRSKVAEEERRRRASGTSSSTPSSSLSFRTCLFFLIS